MNILSNKELEKFVLLNTYLDLHMSKDLNKDLVLIDKLKIKKNYNNFDMTDDKSLSTHLVDDFKDLKTHRRGLSGKIVQFFLRKISLVVKNMLTDIFTTQDMYNKKILLLEKLLTKSDFDIEAISDFSKNQKELKSLEKWLNSVAAEARGNSHWIKNVRDEFFAELKIKTKDLDNFDVKILNESALKKENLKVNIGAGVFSLEDYVNVDMRELTGVDVVARVDDMPFEKSSLEELRAAHLLEHFEESYLKATLLPYWYSLIKENGVFRVIVPNQRAMIKAYSEGLVDWRVLKEVTFGGQDYEGNYHYNMFDEETLEKILLDIGFSKVEFVDTERKNDDCLEMELIAIK